MTTAAAVDALALQSFLASANRFLFFTGKGGVGKTSLACACAIALADARKQVLLVSTDPASNLDETLSTPLGPEARPIAAVPRLQALNIDPEAAAQQYRERIVGPIRGLLPEATVRSIEEQLSGACTTEIASFNEFSRLIGDPTAAAGFDHIILDTAPTGHTLRLLALPAAWTDFIAANKTGSSCLGPLSGLADQRLIYEQALATLRDASSATLALVARADTASLAEAARASRELEALGLRNQALLINARFRATDSTDQVASAMERQSTAALQSIEPVLASLPRYELPYRPNGLTGIDKLRALSTAAPELPSNRTAHQTLDTYPDLNDLIESLAAGGRGVIMTMGKGGVGKTTLAQSIARALAERGHAVHLSTTDPADHISATDSVGLPNLTVSAIDPKETTRRHVESVLAAASPNLDADARALLEEELRSPCTEEIAVFTAFAREVAKGEDQFVVLDTAPTGHTILLLDATEAYHREVMKNAAALPPAVQRLLPRLREPAFTKTLIVTLPEATPVHEAAQLQADLRRAGIEPFAWIVNQCLSIVATGDPILQEKAASEGPYLREVADQHAQRWAVVPWTAEPAPGTVQASPLSAY